MYIELDYDRLSVEQKGVIDKLLSMGEAKEVSWKDCFANETAQQKQNIMAYPDRVVDRAKEMFRFALQNRADEYVNTKVIDELWVKYLKEVGGAFNTEVSGEGCMKKFKKGDRVYHKNLEWYGTFLGYAWESDEECDVDFETEDGLEQRHVSVSWLSRAHK